MKRVSYLAIFLLLVCISCTASPANNATLTATAEAPVMSAEKTPTLPMMGGATVPPTESVGICEGLSGTLEMQILVGPSEAVGLEPVAVGNIPFAVLPTEVGNLAQGSGPITYQDVLEEAWGTYTVNLDLRVTVQGDCEGSEIEGVLNLIVGTTGEQMVEVEAQGFHGEYPWSGTHNFDLSFPIEEGATAEGEGWIFVLHLSE
jgi:hypothetical protein